MSVLLEINTINATTGYRVMNDRIPFDGGKSEIYRECRRHYGRCTGKVYVDRQGEACPVGWVFQRREREEGNWLRETWVTVRQPPTIIPLHELD